jgi:hypothetical protein
MFILAYAPNCRTSNQEAADNPPNLTNPWSSRSVVHTDVHCEKAMVVVIEDVELSLVECHIIRQLKPVIHMYRPPGGHPWLAHCNLSAALKRDECGDELTGAKYRFVHGLIRFKRFVS